MKTCFCGCGREIPRLPLGMRSVNERGRLVAERLAWLYDIDHQDEKTEQRLKSAVPVGESALIEIREAMHGERDVSTVDEELSGRWMNSMNLIDLELQPRGVPTINAWLDMPGSREMVEGTAAGGDDAPLKPDDEEPEEAEDAESYASAEDDYETSTEFLVEIADGAADRLEDSRPRIITLASAAVVQQHSGTLEAAQQDLISMIFTAVKLGYESRGVELELLEEGTYVEALEDFMTWVRFEEDCDDWFGALLQATAMVSAVAVRSQSSDPLGGDEEKALLSPEGIGVADRIVLSRLVAKSVDEEMWPEGVTEVHFAEAWLFGYYLHGFVSSLPGDARSEFASEGML